VTKDICNLTLFVRLWLAVKTPGVMFAKLSARVRSASFPISPLKGNARRFLLKTGLWADCNSEHTHICRVKAKNNSIPNHAVGCLTIFGKVLRKYSVGIDYSFVQIAWLDSHCTASRNAIMARTARCCLKRKTFCCCCSVRTGASVIGWFNFVSYNISKQSICKCSVYH